jgi:hypothetical protein
LTSTSVPSGGGPYIVNYVLSGTNTSTVQTASVTFNTASPRVATFNIPASLLLITGGSNTVTVTSIDCSVPASGQDNTGIFVVNPLSTANAGGPLSACQSATPTAITLTGASVGGGATTGAWSIVSGGGSLSNTAQTVNPQNVTYTPAANYSGSVVLTLTSNFGTGCTAATSDRTITVNALPAAPTLTVSDNSGNGINDGTICSNGTATLGTALAYSGYKWTTSVGTTALSTTANLVVTNQDQYKVEITDANGCKSTSSPTSITVNAIPVVPAITFMETSGIANDNGVICAGDPVTLIGPSSLSNWAWSISPNPAFATSTVSNTTTVSPAATATYTLVVTNSNGCVNSNTATVTVNALPTISLVSPATTYDVCEGSTITLSGSGTALSPVAWGSSNGFATVTNAGVVSGVSYGTAHIKYTDDKKCSIEKTVTVLDLPVVADKTLSAVCSDVALGTPTYNTSSSTVAASTFTIVSVAPASGLTQSAGSSTTNNLSDDAWTNTTSGALNVVYTIKPTAANGCDGATFTYTVPINPEPVVTAQTAMTCSDVALNLNLDALISGNGDTYTYTVASSDATNVPAGSARTTASASNITDSYTNTTVSNVTITYTITPIGSNGCSGNAFTYTVTVKPEPVVNNQTAMTCSDVALNLDLDVLVSGSGDKYTYTVASSDATNVPAGSARTTASASNITDTYTNTTGSDVTITYTITPIGSNGCSGNAFTYTVTVKPEPVVTAQTAMTCSDVALNLDLDVLVSGSGDIYTYTVASSSLSVAAGSARTTASASNITDTYTNTTGSDVTITYTITPIGSNGCSGNAFTYAVTVKPEPVVTAQTAMTCSDVALNLDLDVLVSGSGDTYTYTVASSSLSVAAGSARTTASSSNITDTYTNTTSSDVTITYTITPIGSNGCSGNTFTYTVTVKPEPVVTAQTAMTCSNVALNFNLATLVSGGTFTYTVASSNQTNVPAGSARTTASATAITDNYVNTTGSNVTITYTITPIGSNGCAGNAFDLVVTVKPQIAPSAITFTGNGAPTGFEVCSANNFTLTGTPSGGVWSVTGGTFASSNTATPGAITFAAITAAPTTVTYTVTNASGCATTVNATAITVNALPANPTINSTNALTTSICEGSSILLTGSAGTGGTGSYFTSWTANGPANVTFSPGTNTATLLSLVPAVSPTSSYTIGYSISDSKGCVNASAATAVITVDAKPSLASIPLGNQQKCDDDEFTVTGNTLSVGTGVWSVTGGTALPTNSATTTVSFVTAGTTATATWTVSNGSCAATASNIASVTLQNNILPVVSASNPAANCGTSPTSGTFNIAATVTPSVGTGVWTSTTQGITFGTASAASTTADNVPFGTHTLTYTVTVGSGLGACTVSKSIMVTNNQPASTAQIVTPPQQSCSPAGIFTVNAVAPSVGTGTWTSSLGSVVQTGSSATITGVPQGMVATASWTVTTPSGCGINTATVTLTNFANPTANAGLPQAVCSQTTPFTVTGVKTPTVGSTVAWTVTGGAISGSNTANTATINVSVGNTATATYTVTNGVCPAVSSTVTISNYETPTAVINSGSDIVVCNQTTAFTVTGAATPAAATYEWSVTNGSVGSTTGTSVVVSVTPGNVATLSLKTTNGIATCTTTTSITITNYSQPTMPSITSSQSLTVCNQMGSFPLTGSFTGTGTAVWSVTSGGSITASSTSTASVSVAAGNTATVTYTVTNGTGPNACSTATSVVITNYSQPTAPSITSTQPLTVCGQTGTFPLTGSFSGTGTGVWSVTAGTGSISNTSTSTPDITVAAGNTATITYTVTNGTGPNACSTSTSVTITNYPSVSATVLPDAGQPDQMCPGTSIVLKATPSGGSGSYQSQSFVGGTGSGSNFNVVFETNPAINPNRLATINGISAQPLVTLTYTVFDALYTVGNGCSAVVVYTTKVNPAISVAVSPTPVCVGSMVIITPSVLGGSGTYSVSGGSGTYSTYSWTVTGGKATGISTSSSFVANGVSAGSANVAYAVTDNKGCSVSGTTTSNPITVNPLPVITFTGQVNVLCKGDATGSVTATGGTIYAWNTTPAQNTATATGLAAGTYTVTVTTGSSCSTTSTVTITEPSIPLSVTTGSQTNVLCFGSSTGAVTATGAGGTGTITYKWSVTSTPSMIISSTATATGLAAGSYTVTATDANSCTAVTSVTITQPTSAVSVTIPSSMNVDCRGNATGSATALGTGGTGTITYKWSVTATPMTSISTAATASLLAAGSYTVTATDANSCTATASVTITQPLVALSVTASIATPIPCFGGSGSATAVGAGGTSGYTYKWSTTPLQTTATATGLTVAGSPYTVTVTDANGCTSTVSQPITQPNAITATAAAIIPTLNNPTFLAIKCFGDATGSATVTANGGTGILSYAWSGTDYLSAVYPVTSGQTITGLKAGTYTVTVSDANSCTSTGAVSTVVLTQPGSGLTLALATAILPATNPNNPSCTTGQGTLNDGNGTVSASGGTLASPFMYHYNWGSGNGSTPMAGFNSGLTIGSYTVTVTDDNGCSATVPVVLSARTPVVANAGADKIICSGQTATLDAATGSGGTGTLSINWGSLSGNPPTTPILTTTTIYTVSVSDSKGCVATDQATVTVNPLPALVGVTTPDYSCSDGSVMRLVFSSNSNGADKIDISSIPNALGGFTNVTGQSFPPAGPISISLASVPIPVAAGTYNFKYRVQNSTTGCYSHASVATGAAIDLTVNPRPTVTAFSTSPTQLCDATPTLTASVTSTATVGNRIIRFERDSMGVKTYRNVTFSALPAGSQTTSITLDSAGTWQVVSITDANGCGSDAGGITSPSIAITDARIKVVKVASDSTATFVTGCTLTLSTLAIPNLKPSVGTINYVWTVSALDINGSPLAFVDTSVTTPAITLSNPAMGWRYRCRITTTGTICNSTKFSGVITLQSGTLAANAGPPTSTQSAATFTMTATPPTVGTGLWTIASGTATIANPTSPITRVTLPPSSTATLVWTVSLTGVSCVATDQIVLTRAGLQFRGVAFLHGTLDTTALPVMKDDLRMALRIPLASPYTAAPWNAPAESITPSVLAAQPDPNDNVVDWVLLELRDASFNVIEKKSALIKRNGFITDIDGIKPVQFLRNTAGDFHVAVRHRNHLGVMTEGRVSFINTSIVEDYDFTDGLSGDYPTYTLSTPTPTNQINAAQKGNIKGGYRAMWAGDANSDGRVQYSGQGRDGLTILGRLLTLPFLDGYYPEDLNMNGRVQNVAAGNDRLLILGTTLSTSNIIYQQIPAPIIP